MRKPKCKRAVESLVSLCFCGDRSLGWDNEKKRNVSRESAQEERQDLDLPQMAGFRDGHPRAGMGSLRERRRNNKGLLMDKKQ